MEVMEFTDKDKKIVTISLPLDENYKIQINKDKIIFQTVRSFSDVSVELQEFLMKDYSDEEVNCFVKKARSELFNKEIHGKMIKS